MTDFTKAIHADPGNSRQSLRSKKVLVVDDEPEMLNMLSSFLSNAGYDVSVAADGQTALAMAGKIVPDLVLMDILLPKMDGWVVCHQLKTDINLKKIPIILISGMLERDSEANQMVEKCDYLMAKPIEMKNLLQKVKELTKS